MGGNYEKGMYNQLMEVMARLDRGERENKKEDTRLNGEISDLKKENRLLNDDNAWLKSILNNDSSNTSQPPSTNQKGGKTVNCYSGRTKTGGRAERTRWDNAHQSGGGRKNTLRQVPP